MRQAIVLPNSFFSDCLAQSGVGSRELLLGLVTQVCASAPRTSRRLQPFPAARRLVADRAPLTPANFRFLTRRPPAPLTLENAALPSRTSASDNQRSSDESGSPASEGARGCKRKRDLRTQSVILSRQGRLNEVRCLRGEAQPRADETEQELPRLGATSISVAQKPSDSSGGK